MSGPTISALSDLDFNIAASQDAIKHVRRTMRIGASDKASDAIGSLGGSILCVMLLRSGIKEKLEQSFDYLMLIERQARAAEDARCGNCMEQASIAFVHLMYHGMRPLDYMALTNADHAFVVVGRVAGSKAGDFRTWGKDAVVCDPWSNKAYPAARIPLDAKASWVRDFNAESLCRVPGPH